jgi:urease accessory protein
MNLRDVQPAAAGWQAHLELGYTAREERTVLSHRRHNGPLLVQKPFYPEGARVCHSTLVHPPGGIAGGDRLQIDVAADAGAHAVITTPGATKWYRSNGNVAEHRSELRLASGARLEWLPQASIVFDAAQAKQTHRVSLQPNARYIGWDIVCFGRIARGERFASGRFQSRTEIVGADGRLWSDQAIVDGDGSLLSSPAGLNGQPVSALFLAAGAEIERELVDQCRQIAARSPLRCGVTSLPSVLAVRFMGDSIEAAMACFTALWQIVRPALMDRVACAPRIWQT